MEYILFGHFLVAIALLPLKTEDGWACMLLSTLLQRKWSNAHWKMPKQNVYPLNLLIIQVSHIIKQNLLLYCTIQHSNVS